MSRTRWIVVGALALLLAATPFVPRGGDDDRGAITPSGQQEYGARPAATAGLGRVTPAARAEIDRALATSSQRRAAGTPTCAVFEGQRYCLGTGWTESTPQEVGQRLQQAALQVSARRVAVEETGDLDAEALLRRQPTPEQARAELTAAARSVAKIWLLRHEIQGDPLPEGFLEDHPEARTTASSTARTAAARQDAPEDYPAKAVVMNPQQAIAQNRTYWCGPTAMQMIGWGWKGTKIRQGEWARRLRTTTDGTSIWDMVRVVNGSTGYDREDHAGPYVVLDIGDWSYRQWSTLLMRHVASYRAPVVLHPVLHKRFFPYLDDDASGHFQAGRGYNRRAGKPLKISYFEPWDQSRFDPSEPAISRVQWREAYKSYRANKAHFQHNIGV